MKKIILTLFLLVLVISIVYAFSPNESENIKIPKEIKRFVGNQKINFFIDDKFFVSAEIKNGKVFLNNEKFQKPTLEIFVKNETLRRIASSENPKEEFLNAYKSGEIKVVKKTLKNKIRFWLARFFVK